MTKGSAMGVPLLLLVAVASLSQSTQALTKADDNTPFFWYNELTGEVQDQPPIHMVTHEDEDGNEYFVDPVTEKVSWERPASLAWREAESEKPEHNGRTYWSNDVTGEVQWDKPAILAWKKGEKGFWYNSVSGETQWGKPEAHGHTDPKTGETYWILDGNPTWEPEDEFRWKEKEATEGKYKGNTYYFNEGTGESQWEKPESMAWTRKSVLKTFWHNTKTGESVRDAPVEIKGILDAGTGRHFYIDPATGDATWEKPPRAAWMSTKSTEHDGREFYYNEVTQETVWEMPEDAAWVQFHEDL
jgi:hypothetical protein